MFAKGLEHAFLEVPELNGGAAATRIGLQDDAYLCGRAEELSKHWDPLKQTLAKADASKSRRWQKQGIGCGTASAKRGVPRPTTCRIASCRRYWWTCARRSHAAEVALFC
jgi:hypothetical protein